MEALILFARATLKLRYPILLFVLYFAHDHYHPAYRPFLSDQQR